MGACNSMLKENLSFERISSRNSILGKAMLMKTVMPLTF